MKINMGKLADRAFLILLLGLIFLFIVYPIVSITAISFRGKNGFSLDYYKDILSGDNLSLIGNSLWVAASSSLISTFFSVTIALFAFACSKATRRLIQNAAMMAMISPPFISSLAFIVLFGRRGLITRGLLGLSMNPYGPAAVILLQAIGGIAYGALMLIVALEQIDGYQIMAARDLGAKGSTVIRKIVLPSLWPGILSVFFVRFTMSLADFGTPIIVGGNFRVLATEAYLTAISTPHLGKAAAISILMVPSAMIAFYFYRNNMKAISESNVMKEALEGEVRLSLPRSFTLFTGFCTGLYFLIIALKYGVTILSAFANTSGRSLQLTLDYFTRLSPNVYKSLLHSVIFSLLAGLLSSFIGIAISYYLERRKLPFMPVVEFITSLPYIIPGIFFGLGYVAAFSKQPLYLRGTATILISNYIFRQLTVSIKAANTAFKGISENVDRAGQDLGASPLSIFFRILLPQVKQSFTSSFITVFTSSMSAVGAIVFIISPGMSVASIELFRSTEVGEYGVASVQALFMIGIVAFVNLLALKLSKPKSAAKAKIKVRS